MKSITEKTAIKLARLQYNNPWKFIIFSLLVTLLTGMYAKGLVFDSSYEALLPKNSPEIENINLVRKKTGGTRQVVVAIKGSDPEKRLAFGRKILPKLEKLENIKAVDLEFPIQFFKDRGLWLLDIPTLDRLIPALEDAINVAKSQASPFALHLDEEEDKKELDSAWKKVDDIIKSADQNAPFNKVITSSDNKYTFLIILPTIKFSNMLAGQKLITSIKNAVDGASPKSFNVSVKYAGALEVIEEQHHVMKNDMMKASVLAMIFGILIVAGFTKRLLAPVIIAFSLALGIVWTFAFARLAVGNVNIITGFLASVLIGLGIDFGIHLFVRYLQELKKEGSTLEDVFVRFISGTLPPAITAAATTAGVFATFSIAKFRGFSEFGLIAAAGVIFTLASSFLILPPLLLIVYKKRLLKPVAEKADFFSKRKALPGLFTTLIIIFTLLLSAAGIFGITKIQFKNDFRELRGYSEATVFTDYVNKNLGAGFNPAVFITSSLKDANAVKELLTKYLNRDANKNLDAQVGKVMGVNDLLPKDVEAHKKRVEKLKEILLSNSLNKALEKDTPQAEKLHTARDMVLTTPWTVDDIPQTFKRRFTTAGSKDKGYLVYAWSKNPHDADFKAAAWDKELKEIKSNLAKKGIQTIMGDETLIISWVYKMVKKDAAPLLMISIIVVLIFLIIDFKNVKDIILLILTLFAGMLIFIGVAYFSGLDVNMFNMIVFPSVIGIGIDNAVHILHRYKLEGKGSILFVLKNTGIAALLASFTTAVGFGSSMIAHNLGLKSMGVMAVIGITSTLFAAILVLPSILTLLEKHKIKK
ncbi:MAG: MMPL family transporter [Deltaproteobacteria bacterium]|nr:MMPL family transporter [Deltaproteobacteria bacterium]